MPFLLELAKEVTNNPEIPAHDHWVILPSRRANLYFRSHLKTIGGEKLFLPRIQTIEEFIFGLSDQTMADPDQLLFLLHKCWNEVSAEPWSFDSFLEFGPQLIRDFDHIASSLAPAEEIFLSLEEESSIKRWAEQLGVPIEEGGYLKDENFKFWSTVKNSYPRFLEELKIQGVYSKGLIYRQIAENLEEKANNFKGKKLVFAGFNSLSKSERKILFHLHDRHGARLIWDSKADYLNDEDEEAGRFLREYENSLGRLEVLKQRVFQKDQNIGIYSSQGNIYQSRLAWEVFSQKMASIEWAEEQENSTDHLAIVIPDEKMLFPLLESIPASFKDKNGKEVFLPDQLNITMGLGYKDSSLKNLLNSLFRNLEKEGDSIYYQDLIRIIDDPVFTSNQNFGKSIRNLISWIRKEKILVLKSGGPKHISGLEELWDLLFRKQTSFDLEEYLKGLYNNWFQKNEKNLGIEINKELLRKAIDKAGDLKVLTSKEGIKLGLADQFSLFNSKMDLVSLPFSGEPLRPIHIIGILETRALDFQNVMVLSCNEGTLPRGRFIHSILPFVINKRYELPTFEDFDASSAYSFFRLFHEAKNVDLIYSNDQSEMNRSEPSRFILQILNYWKNNPEKKISEYQLEFDMGQLVKDSQFGFKMSEEIKDRIINYLEGNDKYGNRSKGLSPTALSSYLRSPINFIEGKILEIKEEEKIQMDLDPLLFGTLLHKLIEKALKKIGIGKFNHNILAALLKDRVGLEKFFDEIIMKKVSVQASSSGYSMIQLKMMKELVIEYLKKLNEADEPFDILGMEKNISLRKELELSDGSLVNLLLKGQIDRLDRNSSGLRIIDYKSGSMDPKKMKARNWMELLEDPDKAYTLQLLLYKYMVRRSLVEEIESSSGEFDFGNSKGGSEVKAGICFFGKEMDLFSAYKIEDEPKEEDAFFSYVENILRLSIERMIDPERKIEQVQAFMEGELEIKKAPEV